jgi:hypothetical protein
MRRLSQTSRPPRARDGAWARSGGYAKLSREHFPGLLSPSQNATELDRLSQGKRQTEGETG